LGELFGEDPGDLLEGTRGDVGLGDLRGEEVDFEFVGSGGVLVANAGDFGRLGECGAEFLGEFAGERLREGFPGADLATGKFPLQGGSIRAATLPDEEAAIETFDDGGDDLNHTWPGPAFIPDQHRPSGFTTQDMPPTMRHWPSCFCQV
jgi:hypothetical protein